VSHTLAVLISGNGSNLQAIIDAIAEQRLNAHIAVVLSNNTTATGLGRAIKAGIPTITLDHRCWPDRESFDQEMIRELDRFAPDTLVLAGFMRILSGHFVGHYQGRLLNIHPSLLPRHRGLHTHRQALAAGDTEHGCSVHFVTEELDGGHRPIAYFCVRERYRANPVRTGTGSGACAVSPSAAVARRRSFITETAGGYT